MILVGGFWCRIVGVFVDFNVDWKFILFLNIWVCNDWFFILLVVNCFFFYFFFSGGVVLIDLFNEIGVVNGESDFIFYVKLCVLWIWVGKDVFLYVFGNIYFNIINFFIVGFCGFIVNVYVFGVLVLCLEFINVFEMGVDICLFRGKIGVDFIYYNMSLDD